MNRNNINKHNVGRIAERIVANELEYRGFRVSDLNKEGTSTNADLVAARDGRIWQIQVKGATNDQGAWWFQYGHCNEDIMAAKEPMFNRHSGFYTADIVVLVAVRSPREYCCLVMPVKEAERAADINLNREFRTLKANGAAHKPHKVWIPLGETPRETTSKKPSYEKERQILNHHKDNWGILDASIRSGREEVDQPSLNSPVNQAQR
jgi:Holliday junction resolvase-like predicted endonuclease